MIDEMNELYEKMEDLGNGVVIGNPPYGEVAPPSPYGESEKANFSDPASQRRWSANQDMFWACSATYDNLPPGLYRPQQSPNIGFYLEKQIVDIDELIVLPESESKAVLSEVEKFWTLKERFAKSGFIHKRGLLMWGDPGCHAKDTDILMYDGTIKKVQDIMVDDLLMGPDSKSRKVLELVKGFGKMYQIIPTKGKPFIVNGDHILALHPSGKGMKIKSRFNMSVNDFLKQTISFQKRSKLYRSDKIEFESSNRQYTIPPYILGCWLGDGHTNAPALTNMDNDVINEWISWLKSINCDISISKKTSSKSRTYTAICKDGINRNPMSTLLRELNVMGNKHIPHSYLTASYEDRLNLLAGLMDTDGHFSNGCFDFISKSKQLAHDVTFLARSLGFAAYIKTSEKGCTYLGKHKIGLFWRVAIIGDCRKIPTKIRHKQCIYYKANRDPLVTGFEIKELSPDEYHGFVVNGDHLYLMGDFIVTHNCGKTSTIQLIIKHIIEMGGIALFVGHPKITTSCLQMIRRIEPDRPIVAIMEDFESMIKEHGDSEYLAMLDGESQVGNIVYLATTNYPEKLDKRFIDRPSRFDTIKKIPMPSADARRFYFQQKEPSLIGEELETWVELSDGFGIAHLKEMIISNRLYDIPIEKVVKRLNFMRKRKITSDDALPSDNTVKFGVVGK